MAYTIGPVEDHRGREAGGLVYPVYSRRSRGLSLGINLFPGSKACSFDCPYCEVFPFVSGREFSLAALEEELARAQLRGGRVRDICFSGNGEPSLSPYLPDALEAAARFRASRCPEAALVMITNGTGLLDARRAAFLAQAAHPPLALDIWLKLDAGTEAWYRKMNRSAVPFERLLDAFRAFVARAPVILQTMVCALDGAPPSAEEFRAWITLVTELAQSGNVREVQVYGKARPSPEDPLTTALPLRFLEERASALRAAGITASVFA